MLHQFIGGLQEQTGQIHGQQRTSWAIKADCLLSPWNLMMMMMMMMTMIHCVQKKTATFFSCITFRTSNTF